MSTLRAWLAPPRPDVEVVTGRERRLVVTEILVVATVTLGLSGLRSLISLLDSLAAPTPLSQRQVSIDKPLATDAWVDLAAQLASSLQLVAWGGLGLYLLIRAGSGPRAVGLDGRSPGRDLLRSCGLAALIGIPGLAFYLVTRAIGLNLTVVPSVLDDHWWRVGVLILSALANSWAEEVLVVGWLLSALRRLGLSENRSLVIAAAAAGELPPLPGLRRRRRQPRHGPGVRALLATHRPAVAARRGARADRRGGVRGVGATGGSGVVPPWVDVSAMALR